MTSSAQGDSTLQGRTIIVGVTGGIAAYKAADLVSKLVQSGIDVQVVSTVYAFYRYQDDLSTAIAIAQECNNEVAQMTGDHSNLGSWVYATCRCRTSRRRQTSWSAE